MARRIIIVSSFPVCIILVVLAIVFFGLGRGQAQQADIKSETDNILSLVNEGKQAEADAAVDKLIADYSGEAQLSSAFSDIADFYCWHRKYDGAQRMYSAIINKSPDAVWTTKARLNITRLEILKQIEQRYYEEAEKQLGDMVKDFRDEPNLAVAIFHIGQEFGWQRSYGESKSAFDYLVKDFSNTSIGQEARLWQARANICSLITLRTTNDEEIGAAIDKLINDFSGDSRLTDTLFWISREYEWTKGTSINRNAWLDKPNSVYKQLMQKFGSGQAEWDYKRLNHRMKIFNLMKQSDQNAIDTAIEEMAAEFTGRPELAGEFYWVAFGYEEDPNKCSQAKVIYERIVSTCPDSVEADTAILDMRRRIITDTIIEGDMNGGEVLIDEFVADFKNDIYAGTCLGRVSLGYYKKGLELNQQGNPDSAKEHFERSAGVWQRITENNLQTGKNDAYLYFYAAANYHHLRRLDEAIEIYQKILDDWPDFEYGCGVQSAIGWCYEKMRDSNEVPKEAINPLIEEAYKAVLDNYEGCKTSIGAAYRLAVMMQEKGDKDSAIVYYRKFIELAEPYSTTGCTSKVQASAIEGVKAKIAELEGVVERFDEQLTAEGGAGK